MPAGEPWRFIDMAMPLSPGTGVSGKVLAVHLSWPWLRQRLFASDAAFPPGSDLWLLGPDDQTWLGREGQTAQPRSLAAINWARQGRSGWTVETWPDGHPYITGYTPAVGSHAVEGVHWVTLVRRRADVWPPAIWREFASVALLSSALVLLATASVWVACTLWLRPLRNFALRIGQTREGERPPQPPAHVPQEFHWLNDAIVALVDRLNSKEAAVQRALAEVKHTFRAVGSSIPGVLASFRLNSAGKFQVTYVSDTCERYYGVAADVLLADPMSWSKNVDPEDLQALGRAFTRLLFGTERVLTHSVRFTGGDGEVRTLQLTIIQRDKEDERAFDSISLDITELLQARSEAERAGRVKSDFLASMSHELRTPLNAILGLSRALEEGAIHFEQRRQARFLRESSETLTRTLNDLLDLAKFDAGTLDLKSRRFSLGEVVESSADVFREVAADKGIEFLVHAPERAPALIGDPVRLRQILQNLLSNAFKFTASGQVSLCVKVTDVEDRLPDATRQAQVWISVADTGVGMTAEQARSAFDRFHQIERSTGAPAGTGVGLTIVKFLVEKMGGTISLKSTYAEGTEASALIPFEVASDAGLSGSASGASPFEPSLTVLVADDYDINRHVLRALLEQRGHSVLEAEDGAQAVELVSRTRPDLVLMDVDMPNLDGLEATRRIRAMDALKGTVPIYALTGKTRAEDIERVAASGMDGHLCKPVELDDLVAVLRKALAHRSAAHTGVPANST